MPVLLLTYLTDTMSIKSAERDRRSRTARATNVFDVIERRSIPDWKKLMSVTANKQAFLRFMEYFIVQKHGELFASICDCDELYIVEIFSDSLFARRISSTGVMECKDLYFSHEEADTRMIFHATRVDTQFGMKQVKGRIIIKSLDSGSITSTKDGRRFISVHEIVNSLNPVFL